MLRLEIFSFTSLQSKYHHFKSSHEKPGIVELKEFSESSTEEANILKAIVSGRLMPEVIHPLGMSPDRKKYLNEEIRKFCELEFADVICPRPDSPLGDAGHSSTEPIQ